MTVYCLALLQLPNSTHFSLQGTMRSLIRCSAEKIFYQSLYVSLVTIQQTRELSNLSAYIQMTTNCPFETSDLNLQNLLPILNYYRKLFLNCAFQYEKRSQKMINFHRLIAVFKF